MKNTSTKIHGFRLYGKVLDERYTRLLIRQTDLSLDEIVLLDKLQKKVRISQDDAKRLRKDKLIEGRYPNVYPAAVIAENTQKVEEYLENRAFDDAFYVQQILNFICIKGSVSRSDIRKWLKDKLSNALTDEQKESKIGNLLSVTMRGQGLIHNVGGTGHSVWQLTPHGSEICRKNNPGCKRKCVKSH